MAFLFTGCLSEDFFSSGSGGSSHGASLSQAMQASASGSHESLHNSGSTESYSSVEVNATASSDSPGASGPSGGFALVSYDNRDYCWQVPIDVAYSIPFNGQIESLTRFTITPLSLETERNYLGLFFSGDIVELQPGSLPDRAIKNTWMFEMGLAYRHYFTPAHAFVSPYLTLNGAIQSLQWDYRNPVYVDGTALQSDSLNGVGGYAGFGVAFKRNSHLSFFGEAGFGGTAFYDQSNQGFHNDVFSNFGYFTIKAGLCFKF